VGGAEEPARFPSVLAELAAGKGAPRQAAGRIERIADKQPGVCSEALRTGAELSRLVYDAFQGGGAPPVR
jgi:hypothetical protein